MNEITPIILTYDEEPNIRRVLESLRWADRVVIVDSGSKDQTKRIAAGYENVDWYEHPFEGYASQWEHATSQSAIASPYILALDADMEVTPELAAELQQIARQGTADGGIIGFTYSMHGRPLRSSILKPQPRLLRSGRFSVVDVGHNNEFRIEGKAVHLRARLIHDDRKSADRWLQSQVRYSQQELPRLIGRRSGKALKTWIRAHVWFIPIVIGLLAYIRAGGPFTGMAARKYALERAIYEALLQYRFADVKLRGDSETESRSERSD